MLLCLNYLRLIVLVLALFLEEVLVLNHLRIDSRVYLGVGDVEVVVAAMTDWREHLHSWVISVQTRWLTKSFKRDKEVIGIIVFHYCFLPSKFGRIKILNWRSWLYLKVHLLLVLVSTLRPARWTVGIHVEDATLVLVTCSHSNRGRSIDVYTLRVIPLSICPFIFFLFALPVVNEFEDSVRKLLLELNIEHLGILTIGQYNFIKQKFFEDVFVDREFFKLKIV